MAKAVALMPDALDAPQITPKAATPARTAAPTAAAAKPKNDKPMQLRVPQTEFKAIKIAATQHDQSVSEFMLACFHAYMQSEKHA